MFRGAERGKGGKGGKDGCNSSAFFDMFCWAIALNGDVFSG